MPLQSQKEESETEYCDNTVFRYRQRRQYIQSIPCAHFHPAEAAYDCVDEYSIARKRGYAPACELRDWFEAKRLIQERYPED